MTTWSRIAQLFEEAFNAGSFPYTREAADTQAQITVCAKMQELENILAQHGIAFPDGEPIIKCDCETNPFCEWGKH